MFSAQGMSSTTFPSPSAVRFFPFCHVATSPAGKSPNGFPSAMWPRAVRMPEMLRAPPDEKLSTGMKLSLRLGIKDRKKVVSIL